MVWTLNIADPNVETKAPLIAAIGVTFTTLSCIIVSLRLYVRLAIIKQAGFDDWIILFTWFMSLGFLIVTILQSRWGLGLQHVSDMPVENIFTFGVLQYAGAPFYILSILGFKLSLLFSFNRIAIQRAHRIAIIIMAVATVAFHFSFLMGQLLLCTPVQKQWDPAVVGGHCLEAVPFYTSMASIIILFDVAIMLLPFPVLIKTQIPLKKKVVLGGLFSLGIFITVIQIVRIQTIKSLKNYLDSSDLIMWSMVENNLGIIITSIPPLSPLIKSWKEKASSARRSNYALSAMKKGTSSSSRNGGGKHIHLKPGEMQNGRGIGNVGISETTVVAGAEHEFPRDTSSEDLIFQALPKLGGVKATTEVYITRHNKDSSNV